MKKYIYYFILETLLLFQCAAQNRFDVKFEDNYSLSKYMLIQIGGEESRIFDEREPYVQSATVNLTLDLAGKIQRVDFIEKSKDEDFNALILSLVWSTSGKWRLQNLEVNVEEVNVIIPFLQRTPPKNPKNDRPDLIKRYQEYHDSLTFASIDGCSKGSCVILEEIRNQIGPRIR